MGHDRSKRQTAPTPVFPGTTCAGINVRMPDGLRGPHGERWARLLPKGSWEWIDLTDQGLDPKPIDLMENSDG